MNVDARDRIEKMREDKARADRLRAFVERVGNGPFEWGKSDCSSVPVDWFNEERGTSICLPEYHDKVSAQEVIASYGGLAETWSAIAAENGVYERFGEPELGDIAVIDTRLFGQIGGIVAGHRVLYVRLENGQWRPFGPVRYFVKVFAAS